MKLEKLNLTQRERKRKILYGFICVVLLLIIISLFVSHAKYRNTQSVQVAKGTIDYDGIVPTISKVSLTATENSIEISVTASDNKVVNAYYYSNDNGSNYISSAGSTYTFNNLTSGTTYNIKVYVEDNYNNHSSIYSDSITTKSQHAKDIILANNGGANTIEGKTLPNFANTSCASGTSNGSDCGEATNGMYTAEDDDGISYYFRGTIDNNWVSFGGFYWRIIRINGDGSIRLIYNGKSAGATGSSAQLSSSSNYNSSYGLATDVGYMYTDGAVHGTGTDSTIKIAVDSWYLTNIVNKKDINGKSYSTYVDSNGGFCNDRYPSSSSSSSNGSGGTGTTETYYAAYIRLKTNKTPSLKCTEGSDLFTMSGATKSDGITSKGNGALTYPVGLITADEVSLAGSVYSGRNYSYWLYTGSIYWTMSPESFMNQRPRIMYVTTHGELSDVKTNASYGVRPVINLKADTIFSSGDGTSSNPYVVKTS